MVDLVGRYRMLERNRGWDEHFAAQEQEAHQSWQRNEERRRYDEQTRLARAESERQNQFYQNNAGLFNDSALGDMSPRNAPVVQPTNATPNDPLGLTVGGTASATPTPSTPNAASTQPPIADVGLDLQEPIEQRQYTREELRSNPALAQRLQAAANRGEIVLGNLVGGNVMVYPRSGAAQGQPHIGPVYFPRGETSDIGGGYGLGVDPRFTAGHFGFRGIPRREVEINAADDPLAAVRGYSENQATPSATNTTGPGLAAGGARAQAQSTGAAGLAAEVPNTNAEADAYFQGINDTSRPLQATREMRLARANIDNNLARAQLYAQHGRPDLAAEAFAQGLQGQADYITMERMVLYRAAANGSNRSAERLIEEYNGYPRGSVRLRPTGERRARFQVEIQDESGNWVSGTERPLAREQLLGSLQNLVDAEGAAARSEANTEWTQAVMENERYLTIAGVEARTALARMATDAQIAQMNNEARAAIASGDAQVVQNQETGEITVVYPRYANGQMYMEVERLSTERQRSPDTNSRREVEVPTRTRITGVTGVGAN